MPKCDNCKHAFKFKGVGYCAKNGKPRKDRYIFCAGYEEKPHTVTIEMILPKGGNNEKEKL